MASNRPFGQARCAARYLVSSKRRNAPDGRFHATGGRVLLPQCRVAPCLKCGALRRKARLALRQNNPGEMSPYQCKLVLWPNARNWLYPDLCSRHIACPESHYQQTSRILRRGFLYAKPEPVRRQLDRPFETRQFVASAHVQAATVWHFESHHCGFVNSVYEFMT